MSLDYLRYEADEAPTERELLVMLPGLNMRASDFASEGLVTLAQAGPCAVSVIALGARSDDYFDAGFAETLHREIIAPARSRGYAQIRLLGISLGALGALIYARQYPEEADGLILLAPFLGTPGTIAQLRAAGGLLAWTPEAFRPAEIERPALAWLRSYCLARPARPRLLLGFGTDDRFAESALVLAAALPPGQVVALPGGHDWNAWRRLFAEIIALPDRAADL